MVGQANVNDRSTRPSGHVVNIEHVMTHDNVICYIAVCAFIALTSCTEPGWSKLKLGPHCVFYVLLVLSMLLVYTMRW